MAGDFFTIANADCFITRSGYTGEDGFEISVPGAQAQRLANVLLAQPQVQPIGLGARDTLRLEAGLCLYGHDITTDITPIEAGLTWAMQKIRRPGGERAGGYPGAALIEQQLTHGCARKRVGLISEGRVPVREGTPVEDEAGQILGTVCSGTLSPMLNQPIAMAYLPMTHTEVGTRVVAIVRDKRIPMTVTAMPFIPHRYHR
jgi:aminomethyltransferase